MIIIRIYENQNLPSL